MKRFNGFQLKLFMAMLMVLDHLDHIPRISSTLVVGNFPCHHKMRGTVLCLYGGRRLSSYPKQAEIQWASVSVGRDYVCR